MLREQLAVNCKNQAFRISALNLVAHYLLKPTLYLDDFFDIPVIYFYFSFLW